LRNFTYPNIHRCSDSSDKFCSNKLLKRLTNNPTP
jgi:hypothetical protein